jgi:DeoR/GlpR family transcriptional regulator of sugar metabolism
MAMVYAMFDSCNIMHKHAISRNPSATDRAVPLPMMLTTQRKQLILDRLRSTGQIVAKALSEELGISEDTVRRDLRELAAEGLLQRVHGGALPASAATGSLQVREQLAPEEKRALGRAGAALVQPGQVVILDGGTTSLQVVRHLPLQLRATVVTHSPAVAVALAARAEIEVLVLGGRLFRHSMVNVGASVVEAAALLRADLYLMGVTGVHAEAGLTTGDFEEAAVKRALHQRAAETVVLASSDKLGAASAFAVAPLRELAALVVPPGTPPAMRNQLRAGGVRVDVAAA